MLSLIAGAFTVASVYLAGRKNIWAWPLGLAGAALWVYFALQIEDAGVLLMNAFFCALYVWNFITWKGFTMPVFIGREARIRRLVARIKRDVRRSEEVEEAHRRLQDFFAARFGSTQTSADQCEAGSVKLQEVEPPPYVEKQSLEDCKTCGCLLSSERSVYVEVCVYDIGFQIAREGQNMPPHENLVHPVRFDFYCKRDRPAYDRVVYVPQIEGETIREFFVRKPDWAKHREVFGAIAGSEWRQVTEEGEQYD